MRLTYYLPDFKINTSLSSPNPPTSSDNDSSCFA